MLLKVCVCYLLLCDINSYNVSFSAKDGTTIHWNGGLGKDSLDMYFVSTGNTNLELFGDANTTTGANFLTVRCADIACVVLSRQTFCEFCKELDVSFCSGKA